MEEEGFFGPTTAAWRIHREVVLLAAGPRALLLQLAHPLVAAGVGDHSAFQRDPLARLRRTLDLTLGIVFGDRAQAEACSRRLHEVHRRVEGVLADATRCFPAGTPYRALDPPLLLWVHATLVDSTLAAYQRFVRRLSLNERQRYYQESKILAQLVGVPEAVVPADLPSFRRYVAAMFRGPELEITPSARLLAQAVLNPPRPLWLRSLRPLSTLLACGLLPPRLRAAYGLSWGSRERLAWRVAQAGVRRALPWTPANLRFWGEARRAEARVGDLAR